VRVAREKRAGLHSDGGGLFLQVGKSATKSWIFRYWVPERDPASGDLVIDAPPSAFSPIFGVRKQR
jgi:hypothetical protein